METFSITSKKKGIAFAILAASLYAINAPFSKVLLRYISPTLMAGFLYLGCGLSMAIIALFRKSNNSEKKEDSLSFKDLPFVISMILLDILAPIFLLLGLKETSAANVSLLNNFEIVATSLIALVIFKEKISLRLWGGIVLVTFSCILLSLESLSAFEFTRGSLFVLGATLCWGFENNCTRKLSFKDPLLIVLLKGIFSGLGSVIIGLIIGERIDSLWPVLLVMVLGSVAYGLSIYFYVYAQRLLGAARTSAYYAIAPFIGTLISLIIFREIPGANYYIALGVMVLGTYLVS
ncbi:MAG: DMT family transporter [Sphaerochaetaceae bacterium]|nr:DMT family transporter [Sphaerochaetaceae bacterium]